MKTFRRMDICGQKSKNPFFKPKVFSPVTHGGPIVRQGQANPTRGQNPQVQLFIQFQRRLAVLFSLLFHCFIEDKLSDNG